MDTHIHIHNETNCINSKLDNIMATQAELAQQLTDVATQVEKTKTEITTKISDLEAAIVAAGNTSPEVDAALASLKSAVQGVDDIVPDTPAPTE